MRIRQEKFQINLGKSGLKKFWIERFWIMKRFKIVKRFWIEEDLERIETTESLRNSFPPEVERLRTNGRE